MNRSNRRFLPIASLLVAATLWGLVWYPLRLLDEHGIGGLWASLVCYLAVLLPGLPWLWRSGPAWRRNTLLMGLMALAVGWTNVAFVLAVIDGTVVRVLLLFYLSPLWALILGWVFLGEHPGRQGLLVFTLAIIGAVTMLWDPAMGMPWPRDGADWLAASSGLAFALTNVLVRRLHDVSVQDKSATDWLGVALVAGLWILIAGEPVPQTTAGVWLGAVLLGWFGFMIMTVTVVYGVTHMPVHRSAVILLFELVVGSVSAMLLTDERVLPQEWIGGALILSAAWLAAHAQVGETA
jgi:drug/metabolite transporter (DMT)-like permease